MKRSEQKRLYELFRLHRGEMYRMAKALGIGQNAITSWFKGQTVSARIEAAVLARAAELAARDHPDPTSQSSNNKEEGQA